MSQITETIDPPNTPITLFIKDNTKYTNVYKPIYKNLRNSQYNENNIQELIKDLLTKNSLTT